MAWRVIEIDNWRKFSALADRLIFARPHDAPYVLRGQADAAWGLSPSLLRLFPADVTAGHSRGRTAIADGVQSASTPPSLGRGAAQHPPTTSIAGMVGTESQHHHAPTRLLDWTRSPYVAAYFAVEQAVDKPGAVFVVHVPTASRTFISAFAERRVTNRAI